ncbi:hypothetical protein TIFTF001_025801 [Ficus carica]|uniref:Uncharacterized protein n=1 Tax=Ficus carica TaxID=3494 RepID=A0AA88AZ51_FICCA|nr:hypothetical protein TIFTF001_025801 [Ficus carica]
MGSTCQDLRDGTHLHFFGCRGQRRSMPVKGGQTGQLYEPVNKFQKMP